MRKNISLFVVAVAGLLILGSCGNNMDKKNVQDSKPEETVNPEEKKDFAKYPPESVADLSERILGTEWITDDSLKITIAKDSTIFISKPNSGLYGRATIPAELSRFKVEFREATYTYSVWFTDIYFHVRRSITFNPDMDDITLFSTDGRSYNDQKIRQVL